MSAEDIGTKYVRWARQTAIITFLLGTAIFLLYLITGSYYFLFLGYAYIAFAALVNLAVAAITTIRAIRTRDWELFKNTLLIFLNVPVMFLYVFITFFLLNTARIGFTNGTKFEMTDLVLSGCEEVSINELQPGETEIVWIDIPHDCTINLSYMMQGDTIEINVSGYMTTGMGGPYDFTINGSEEQDSWFY